MYVYSKHLSFFILKKKEEENYKVFVENGQIWSKDFFIE
jgi:hypothetical protein